MAIVLWLLNIKVNPMKKILVFIYLVAFVVCSAYSQQNTNYGTGTVSIGSSNSSFGYYAGHNGTAAASNNSFFGAYSGRYNTTGDINSFFGNGSGRGNTTGSYNTAIGVDALYYNQTGSQNVAVGNYALQNNTANQNTAVGSGALFYNTTGNYNAAVGFSALFSNNTGVSNTAIGQNALWSNTTGSQNTALGHEALAVNATGFYNTAVGFQSLYSNTASRNTAIGTKALIKNTTGERNTANGNHALYENTTGYRNVALGSYAMYFNNIGNSNTATGYLALYYISTGSFNSALGYNAGPTQTDLNNTTAIGHLAVPTASDQVRIGNTAVTSIGGQVEWTAFSDGRFKKDVKEDVSGLDFINHLRPVSYVVDKDAVNQFLHVSDSSGSLAETKSIPMRQTGFIAQEVEALVKKTGYVFSGIDAPKNENDPYGIRYATFVVPLVKAVQELSTKVEEQQQHIQLLLAQLDLKSKTDTNEVSGNTRALLLQNNPNPFTSETEIKMTLPENIGNVAIMIYTLEGKQLKNIRVHDRGEVSVKISGNELSAGMYLYTLIADGKVLDTKRMILTQ